MTPVDGLVRCECGIEGRIFEPVRGYLILGHVRQPEPIHPFRLARDGQASAVSGSRGNPAHREGSGSSPVRPLTARRSSGSRRVPTVSVAGSSSPAGKERLPGPLPGRSWPRAAGRSLSFAGRWRPKRLGPGGIGTPARPISEDEGSVDDHRNRFRD